MRISEQIKVFCVRNNISVSELARRTGTSPQNFNAKLKRQTFTVEDLEQIAEATDSAFDRQLHIESYNKAFNRLVREFSNDFCKDDGSIDWEKLVEFNSGD